MKLAHIIIVLFIILSSNLYAFDMKVMWSNENKKFIKVECSSSESLCRDLCNKDKVCLINEKLCRNCIGAHDSLNRIFQEVGNIIVKNDYANISNSEIIELLTDPDFISLTSRSLYNTKYRYNSLKLKAKFLKMCNLSHTNIIEPILFLYKPHLHDIAFMACGDKYYKVVN